MMRCLSIADALKEAGDVIIFLISDEESSKLVQKRGFAYLVLNSDWQKPQGELPELLSIIKENRIETILVDSYYVTEDYCRALNAVTRVFYLDDLGQEVYSVDTLINYNIYASEIGYESLYHKRVMKVPRLLLGCDYAPLRKEFWNVEYTVQKTVKNVLVTTGGSDSLNIAGKLLQLLEETAEPVLRGMHYYVVSGPYNRNAEQLRRLEKRNANFHVHVNVSHMAELMEKCDVAIASYGSTMYELCAIGIPTIGFSFVDNQKKAAAAFGRELTRNAGDVREDEDGVLNQILTHLLQYACFYQERCLAHEKMRTLLNGSGARLLARTLKSPVPETEMGR